MRSRERSPGPDITVRVATPDEHYGGDDERNIVNRLTHGGVGGVQLEQSLPARRDHGTAIADAVASVYRRRLRPRWQRLPLDVVEWFRDASPGRSSWPSGASGPPVIEEDLELLLADLRRLSDRAAVTVRGGEPVAIGELLAGYSPATVCDTSRADSRHGR